MVTSCEHGESRGRAGQSAHGAGGLPRTLPTAEETRGEGGGARQVSQGWLRSRDQ